MPTGNKEFEIAIVKLQKDVEFIKREMERDRADDQTALRKINKFIEDFDDHVTKRFAAKWVEHAMKWFVGIICATVVIALLSTVVTSAS